MTKSSKSKHTTNKKSANRKPAKKTNQQSTLRRVASYIAKHKVIFVASLLLLIPINYYASNAYSDWDNAQLIKGLARDFPLIVDEVNAETGLDLEYVIDCSTTQEKFSSGVNICSLISNKFNYTDTAEIKNIIQGSSSRFIAGKRFKNEKGDQMNYRNKNICSFLYIGGYSFECTFAVNDANIELARELLLDQQ